MIENLFCSLEDTEGESPQYFILPASLLSVYGDWSIAPNTAKVIPLSIASNLGDPICFFVIWFFKPNKIYFKSAQSFLPFII